jgi:hypothetical protein
MAKVARPQPESLDPFGPINYHKASACPDEARDAKGQTPYGGLSLVFRSALRLAEPEDRAEGSEDAQREKQAGEVELPAHRQTVAAAGAEPVPGT